MHRVVCVGTGAPREHTTTTIPAAAQHPGSRPLDDPGLLEELGADPALAKELADAPAELITVPLHAYGSVTGALVLARRTDALGDEAAVLDAMTDALAQRAALAVASARIYEERAALASTLRAALLPPDLPDVEGVELGARYRPAQQATAIGGDFYQVYPCGGAWAFDIGDVCGKGVNAAVLTGQARQSLRTAALVETDPVRTLTVLNDAMLAVDGSKFLSVVHGRFARRDGGVTVHLATGGHPPPLLLRRDGTVQTVETTGMIVGMLREARFRGTTVELEPGETLLLYTDGVTEARVGDQLLGSTRLAAMVGDCVDMTAQAITERIEQLVLEYLDGRSHDDIALLALRAEDA
ncbi:PP2C family protein-serine/threonine phosphatase [Sporichthya polymorpha]|uniref:PP2C family protein-serine/threonine phosphatase n=1 Tax=Sporichthya polymorpha TaxID=35751 RepID=UPI0003674089|nr:PP2C family protein-serine/threonine phosphatase [Sporichthya polymorpha]